MTTVRSVELSARAYAMVSNVRSAKCDPARYLSFAKTFPTLIHTCGLAQATAFALAKGSEHALVLDHLAGVMHGRSNVSGKDLQALVRDSSDLVEYQRLTRNALTAATWLKRFAEALLSQSDTVADQSNAPGK